MPLDPSTLEAMASRCAPAVAAQTMLAIAHVESGLEPLAISVNGPVRQRLLPHTRSEAEETATSLIRQGRNIDLGLLQVNSKTLDRLAIPITAAFDLCRNIQAASRVLQEGYAKGDPARVGAQTALRIALSYYNTGRPNRGFANGYVARVIHGAPPERPKPTQGQVASTPPSWDVFAAGRTPQIAVFDLPTDTGAYR